MDCFSGKVWHHLPAKEVLEVFQVEPDKGLDTLQVKWRTDEFGPNSLTARRGKTKLERFLLQFHQPLVYILIAAGIITAALGEVVDSGVIIGVVLVNAIVGYIQEAKAAGALEALANSMITEAVVIRSGSTRRVAASELVPGDIVILRSGDKVPADLRLVAIKDLRVDESALTGESVPVGKSADLLPQDAVLGDRRNMAYASTLITYGQATGVVVSTGDCTEIGRISTMVSEADELATPLTRKITSFSHILLWAILGLAALTFAAGVLRGEKAADMFMAAVALAVGAIPEGLPAAVTVILAMGVSRMASRGAIIRKLPAVETLGGASVICSDKTGTLTENQMTVTAIFAGRASHEVSGTGYKPEGSIEGFSDTDQALRTTLLAGLLCNDTRIEYLEGGEKVIGDPTEAALIVAAGKGGLDLEAESKGLPRLDTLPFESEHQYMGTLHDQGADTPRLAFFKGSVEAMLDRATMELLPDGSLAPLDHAAIRAEVERLGLGGMRVLAMGCRELPKDASSLDHGDVASDLIFLGLTAMIDPPRPEAIRAVQAFHRAGVNVKMITGDHAVTAAAIGVQLGLGIQTCPGQPTCQVMSGSEMALMSDEELIAKAADTSVFARVAPDQKLRLVMALQNRGEVVAMTGDGVNDAPALKQADIGVAMGRGGTEAAKEASDMILTDDNFATIEAAVEEGRGVYDNLLKFIVWTLPTNVGEGLVILAAVLLGVALPILPVQILWINMTTAGCLGLMLAFEPKEPGIMDRDPRDPRMPILDSELYIRIMLVGGLLLIAAFGLYEWELQTTGVQEQARTVAVNVFVMVEAFYLFNSRSFTRSPFALGLWTNPWVVAGFGIMVILQLAFTYVPFMNVLFGSAPIGLLPWLKIIGVSILAFIVIEIEKWLRNRPAKAVRA
ncbi:ATPase, P-type (transporting), HAD superfamily, subfamily IC [Desulfomicrobium norvegicum]|uniref:ATPase, P-type (Transporting), HAD superfamily, subfamily IC n=1 Tax=Desulfomicrobium norvegicum (strain DSM 1741 / NCIMB 8310) TaxID=52561 RepID=A0A8G2C188_DESNO|nr:cation-transporting P-type ATPase [Desulfomicrobium norvegicum]SFL46304.1 ATPase, P-type (transporting), HAD superfamily, subfamily IC [Desulfomicrobium norvegicum]